MAESPVLFLLDKLTSLLQEEVQLLKGVRTEVQFIKDELERLKAILRMADALEDKDPELKVWVKQVRDVAHDMEDAIDEFTIRLVNHRGHGHDSALRRFASSIQALRARHRIASNLQEIKARVENISKGRRSITEAGSSSSHFHKSRLDSQGDALLLEEADLVGIEKPKKQLIDLLFQEEQGKVVIPIYGMGGLGKTTVAKQVYDDPKLKKRFKMHAWVTVSQSFKIKELLRDLVQQLYKVIGKPAPAEVGTMKSDNLKEVVKSLLQQSRYLIVLDDIWRVNAWDAIKLALPNNNYGSRIMLTTRNREVALSCCTELQGKTYNLEFLPEHEAWSLFCKKTFQGNACPPHLEESCKTILKRCGGLPLAIVAISGALATKDKTNIEEWLVVSRSIASEIESSDRMEDMNKVLSLSFNELPYYLKSCLLYLIIFPEFYAIEHMRLIRLWIAEGFVTGEEGRTLEEVAESYLKELLNRSLIQVVEKGSDGRMKTCRVHDFLRDIINLKSKDQNFATLATDQDMIWPERVRRLSVMNSLQNVQQNRTSFQLRSLLLFSLADSHDDISISSLFSNGCRLLKVLDLQDAPLESFPAEIVNLYHLKYLSLKNTKVKSIPASIKKLQNLETLDLKHSHVTELPAEILELHRLRHLLVYRYEIESYAHFFSRNGFKLPGPIGCMQSLQKLCFIEADQGSQDLMVELGKLTQLRRLGIRKLKKEDGAALCSSIQKMTNLRSLSITAIEEDEIIDIQNIVKPPPYLRQLYLCGRLGKLPEWIPSLHNLVRVYLKWSRLEEDPLVYLQDLPNLIHLEFLQVFVGETLHFKAEKFPSLKLLGLDDLDGLKSVIVEEGAMPNLKRLIIQRCGSLKQVPSGIEHLSKLKAIDFFDMPDELINALSPNGGKDNWRVAHVPAVYSNYWKSGTWDVYSLDTLGERDSSSSNVAMKSHEIRPLWKV
ncbi:disease resistance protein RPM1-like isoform X1 [Prosopis cineraria]|uniref:disease resistance protein RPM1-like isoform X1 n=1 Tax=Prosopis cineraria TaxID=364024 RepID=UPI00240F6429|nr:disease resistance protein RPM1-like isoform X1 [Prosopis cineraria]